MKLVSRRQKASTVAEDWIEQYCINGEWCKTVLFTGTKEEIYNNLVSLGNNPNPDDVDSIIGNKGWTLCCCDDCGSECEQMVELGQEPDYDSATANICFTCLKKAVKLK